MELFDVIVVGGGISGSIAAIAAARCGAKTLLVEQYGCLGGMLTSGGVGPMMSFHAGDKQVVKGITDELIQRMASKGKSPGHIFDTTGYTYTVTPFDAEGMKHELELMLLEGKGQLLYHTMLAGVDVEGNTIKSITVCNKAGLGKLTAKVWVDATGDADLCAWAGVKTCKGREQDGIGMPMTMNLKARNVDIEKVRAYIKNNPEEFPRINQTINIIDNADRLSIGGYVKTVEKAVATGELSGVRSDLLFFETNYSGEVIVNTSRILGKDSTDPWSLTSAEIEGRRHVRELERFLKKRVEGFEDMILEYSGPSVGVRSSRQIQGMYNLKVDELVSGKSFVDVIAHGGYPVDIHPPKGESDPAFIRRSNEIKHLLQGEIYSIPYRCLINPYIHNVITVGRCISTDFEAQGAIRVTPIAGATGHAGGVAAAMAARSNGKASDVPVVSIQARLKEQGAYLEI